jgi:hypothetical protein
VPKVVATAVARAPPAEDDAAASSAAAEAALELAIKRRGTTRRLLPARLLNELVNKDMVLEENRTRRNASGKEWEDYVGILF